MAGIRPHEFWRQTPRETHDTIKVCLKKENEQHKELWNIARWMTMHIINISQKYMETPLREEQLFVWTEDLKIKEIDPAERMQMAMENLRFLKSKAWTKIRGDSLDDIKVFNEDDYEKLMKKKMKENN